MVRSIFHMKLYSLSVPRVCDYREISMNRGTLNFNGCIYCLFKEKIIGQVINMNIVDVVHKSSENTGFFT